MARQVDFTRRRAEALVELANEENPGRDPVEWVDPTENQRGRHVRMVLEGVRVTDDREPFFKHDGEFRFYARAWTPDNGEQFVEEVFPRHGVFRLGDLPGGNRAELDAVLFDGWVEGELALEVGGVELDTFDPDDRLSTFKRVFTGDPSGWMGRYGPTGGRIDPQDPGGWQLWFRIEPGG